jgi:hypothetical protein
MNASSIEHPDRIVVRDMQGRNPKIARIVSTHPTTSELRVEYWHICRAWHPVGDTGAWLPSAQVVREWVYSWQVEALEAVWQRTDDEIARREYANNSRLRKLALAKNALREAVTA